ncbi:Polyol:NADP oxidoreductase [Collinsella aerofaciens]|nr:Polyol:NADP oxidoreductase [Collinsella aerofaciens]
MVSLKNWKDEREELAHMGVELPRYDVGAVRAAGVEQPRWIHFGAGNLYRAFHAQIAQELANKGLLDRGVIVAETFRPFTLDEVYAPFNNDILQVVMNADGSLDERVLAITADGVFANSQRPGDFARTKRYFESPELQMATFTITEKGFGLRDAAGELLPYVKAELEAGPDGAASSMGIVCALLLARFNAGAAPIAMVSTDNFSQNGRRFREAILAVAKGWLASGHVSQGFVDYVSDESRVSFPWSMIDRITPNPSPETEARLREQGWSDLDLIKTSGPTFAGFANTEACHYLVIEDSFPNGRPALEEGGVIMCDRDTAEKADTMKVTACLNPLHTCLAVFGCLLGYDRIWAEMEDADLSALVHHLGYDEDLPVVVDPKVIDPQVFIDELVCQRLVNKSLPDAPQRIATDTSQKVAIRYGHTLNSYLAAGKDVSGLTYIPLTIAGWLRYLIGIDDEGKAFECSPDPLLAELQGRVFGLKLGASDATAVHASAEPILSNKEIFTLDLYEVGLGEKIEGYLLEMLGGPGFVRATIHKYL